MKEQGSQQSSTKHILVGGVTAGVIGGVIAIVVAAIIEASSGLHFAELTPVTIALASVIPNVLGALVYTLLLRRTTRPKMIFTIIALVLAALDTINVSVHAPHVGFATVADPLHFIVALAAVLVIPRFAKSKQVFDVG